MQPNNEKSLIGLFVRVKPSPFQVGSYKISAFRYDNPSFDDNFIYLDINTIFRITRIGPSDYYTLETLDGNYFRFQHLEELIFPSPLELLALSGENNKINDSSPTNE